MKRLGAFVHTLWRQPARWSLALLAVLVAASVWLWFTSLDLRKQLAQVQEDHALALRRTQALGAAPIGLTAAKPGSLQGFQNAFPASALREQRILSLLMLANRHGLQVKQTSLRAIAPGPLLLLAYDVSLPITGRYTSVRGFLDEALHSDPGLALRSVKLQRTNSQTDIFQAQLEFTLWMQVGGGQ